jgi:hypothetical protein
MTSTQFVPAGEDPALVPGLVPAPPEEGEVGPGPGADHVTDAAPDPGLGPGLDLDLGMVLPGLPSDPGWYCMCFSSYDSATN